MNVRVAAVQMRAELGNVQENMKRAKNLARRAFKEGAEIVILPEFFTSPVAFSPKLLDVPQPIDGEPAKLLKDLAAEHSGVVGGSFIAYRDGDAYNTFILAFPDGSVFLHDKDQPTMWENCYYIGGSDDGILDTPLGKVGVALCWEFIRTRTAKRMLGRVEAVIGGSAWWTLPEKRLPGFPDKLHDTNLEIMRETPVRFARLLGVPVIHAAHAGEFEGGMPLLPGFPFKSYYLGETMIVDAEGRVLERMSREDGEGFVMADVIFERRKPVESIPRGFWIPKLPIQLRLVWWYQNLHGRWYYRLKTRPYLRRKFSQS
ncbi:MULTISPECIES: carbon-nitrogen hydrolase family protein [unclassified Archaeoglobus]|jgi:predicted amidohydrolase|uniref:carbon-nitrogen hydrolase family protein n=1 Tax=unclassified Archaeoglobus TaxID=2643606 RepID=UPI0025BE5633|nr:MULTISPECIES: carbon-nitrogen hydrolase family protein [unclassified Archaeoglobus]